MTLEKGRGKYSKFLPFAFTEQEVAMLSSILNSERAIMINIQIMRTFVRIKELIITNKELRLLITKIERRVKTNKENIEVLANLIHQLLMPPKKFKIKMGFFGEDS